jgi:hypothetical protein
LFTTATGLGSMIGYLVTGRLYDVWGGAGLAFALAGALELVPLALVVFAQRRARATAPAALPATD